MWSKIEIDALDAIDKLFANSVRMREYVGESQ